MAHVYSILDTWNYEWTIKLYMHHSDWHFQVSTIFKLENGVFYALFTNSGKIDEKEYWEQVPRNADFLASTIFFTFSLLIYLENWSAWKQGRTSPWIRQINFLCYFEKKNIFVRIYFLKVNNYSINNFNLLYIIT